MNFRVGAKARAELLEAAFWYDDQQPALGNEFLYEAEAIFSRLAAYPLQFPISYKNLRRALLKRFPYAVYFELDSDKGITVIAVLHQRQDRTQLDER